MTAPVTETEASELLSYRYLVDDQLWERLVARIAKDEDMERSLAERIMNEALGFLKLCASNPSEQYSPSSMVDIGWHTFILYTREYAQFCQRIANRFIHHEPSDIPGVDYASANNTMSTKQAMLACGRVDDMLWASVADCNDSGCRDSSCNQGCATR